MVPSLDSPVCRYFSIEYAVNRPPSNLIHCHPSLWAEQIAKDAAFLFHRAFVRDVILPHFTPIGVCAFLIEIAVAGASALPRSVRPRPWKLSGFSQW
jgi:hypothetical protein